MVHLLTAALALGLAAVTAPAAAPAASPSVATNVVAPPAPSTAYSGHGAASVAPAAAEVRPAERTVSPVALAKGDKSIAVLPFTNMSEDKDNAFFADGTGGEYIRLAWSMLSEENLQTAGGLLAESIRAAA